MSWQDELKPLLKRLKVLLAKQSELERNDPQWKRTVRAAFTVFFLLVWLNAAAAAFVHISTLKRNQLQVRPDATHTQPLRSHGRIVYVTPEEMARVQFFMRGFFIGIPTAIALAFVLELVGIGAFEPKKTKKPPSGDS